MLKGALIGAGKIAMTGHMPAYVTDTIKDKIKITACLDSNEVSRKNFSIQFPGIPIYSSFAELYSNQDLDFIDICVPPGFHYEYIVAAIENNLNILCEKPFILSVEVAEKVKERLLKTKKIFMPCHQYKYAPVWKNFKNIIDGNSSKWMMQSNVCRTQADSGYSPDNPDWRTDRALSGGGILADTGVHYIYLSSWMLGKPKSVTARTHILKHTDYNTEDTVFAVFENEKGITQLNLTWAADRRTNSAILLNNSVSMYYNGETLVKNIDGDSEIISVPDASDKSSYVAQYVCLIEDFVERIINKQDCDDCIHEAYNTTKILYKSYESARKNCTIFLE